VENLTIFIKKFFVKNDLVLHLKSGNIDLNNDFKEIEQPYKFGKLNISIKQNNTFVNLRNKKNIMIYLKNAGSSFLRFKNAKKKLIIVKKE